MKKYARLRATSSFDLEQCEACDDEKQGAASTAAAAPLDDDDVVVDTSAPGKYWNSLQQCPRAHHGFKHDHVGDDRLPSSSSHRVLADALKKLSSLRETHHDHIVDPLPRGVSATSHTWGARIVSDSETGGGESHSTFFSGSWQRPRSAIGAELQSSSFRSTGSSNGGAVGSIRTESSCKHTSHFTHRRSSSMHDFTVLGAQPSAARPTAMAIGGLNPARHSSKTGFVPWFHQNDSDLQSPPQRRWSSTSTSSASAAEPPSARRLSANSPLQKSCSLWEENDDLKRFTTGRPSAKRAGAVQSMRYDRLQSSRLMGVELSHNKDEKELQSQSVREGAAHAQAIAAMAKAYAEKYGVAQAVVECVSCGRGLGVIVEGNSPGSYDSSFCRSCRPPGLPLASSTTPTPTPSSSSSSSSWKKGASGMMHYCRKLLLRMGKKPSHKYTIV